MEEHRYRIGKVTAAMMIIVALLFDLFGGVGTKIFHLIGSVAAATVGWIPIFGQLLGGFALAAGILLGEVFGWMTMAFAYLTMYLWFAIRKVSILFGRSVTTRATLTFCSLTIEMIPIINIIPAFSIWAIGMIMLSRIEDRHAQREQGATISRVGRRRRMRRLADRTLAKPVEAATQPVHDNAMSYEQAT